MRLLTVIILFVLTSVAPRAEVVLIGSLAVKIPAGFKETLSHGKDRDMDESRWETGNGCAIQIIYFASYPQEPGEPMVEAREEPIEVIGKATTLIETKRFFGSPKKVLVVYLDVGESHYIIYSERMTKDSFIGFLKNIRRSSAPPHP